MRGWLSAVALCAVALGNPALAATACGEEKLAAVRSPPLPGDGAVLIDCDLTLTAGDVITRSLYFNRGAVSDGVSVDCDGATLTHTPVNIDIPRINVQSYEHSDAGGATVWEPTRDITIRNCIVLGAVNVNGMGWQGSPAVQASSRTDPNHTAMLRSRAPTNITFDRLTVDPGGRIAVYLAMGVTGVMIQNSVFLGTSSSTALYLDAEGGFNNILNNRFAIATAREVIAIDGSSQNRIAGNEFTVSPRGGIFIYRNCGEAGTVRHNEPIGNDLLDNRFLDPSGPQAAIPHIAVASRNGNRPYCEDDAGYPFGSSVDNRDMARFTAIKGNYFQALAPAVYLGDGPNYVIDNVAAAEGALPSGDAFGSTFDGNRIGTGPQPPSACFWRAEMPMLLRDGEALDLDLSTPGAVSCAAQRLVCQAGVLSPQANACDPARIAQRHFRCAVKASNDGCAKALTCGGRKRIQAVKARCNLEHGPVDRAALAAAAWNTLAVDRASDVVGDGHCGVGAYDIATGATHWLGSAASPTVAHCREADANGGDCQIEGHHVCY